MLRKITARVFVPAVPAVAGSPSVPAQPEQYICYQTPAVYQNQTICETVCIPATPPPGGFPPGDSGYICGMPYCRTTSVLVRPAGPTICRTEPAQPFIPAVPYQPGVPSHFEARPTFAWDAGAISIDEMTGDCQLTFEAPDVIDAVVGFVFSRGGDLTDWTRIGYGLRFTRVLGGSHVVQIVEGGRPRGRAIDYTPGDTINLRRVGDSVQYVIDSVLRRTISGAPTSPATVAACLFAAEDKLI